MRNSVSSDINDMFAEAQESYHSTDHYEKGRIQYNTSTLNSQIRSLGEIFCEYYLNCPSNVNSLSEFLKQEQLDKIISQEDFQKLICGEAFLSADALEYFRLKLPFALTSNKMHELNTRVRVQSKSAEELKLDMDLIAQQTKELHRIKEEDRQRRYHEYDVQYALAHREEINQKAYEKYHNDDDYRQKLLEKRRQRYKNISEKAREKIYASQRAKYATSPDYKEYVRQKNAKRCALEKQRMLEDPEYAAEVREKRRKAKQKQRAKKGRE